MSPRVDRLPLTMLPLHGGVTPCVIVCGDPKRATKVSSFFDDPRQLSENREYRSYVGRYKGTPITVCSHGIGAPGASIAFEELIRAGAKRIIRVGTCGSLQRNIVTGHIVVVTAAVDCTGYAKEVVPAGFPAVADCDLTLSLKKAAEGKQHVHTGIVVTRDCFYRGIEMDIPGTPSYPILSQANVLAVEMECSALFIVGTLRKIQTASILTVDGNVLEQRESMDAYRPHAPLVAQTTEATIQIALDALVSMEGGVSNSHPPPVPGFS